MPALTSSTPTSRPVSIDAGTRPLTDQLIETLAIWAGSQHRLIILSAEFADSTEWIAAGYPTPAHWLAEAADIEACTAREWIRIGRQLQTLEATADAYKNGEISYSKVRTLTRHATPDNEAELLDLARKIPAAPGSFIRAPIHDSQANPIDATNRRRHPTTRQKRLVDEQHQHRCKDCGRADLLHYDHNPEYEQTHHTITTELELRCAPCHTKRHQQAA